MSGKRKNGNPLEGMCFAISGSLSVGRSQFEEFLTQNGGTIAKSITKSCTHLITYVIELTLFTLF